MTNQPTEQLVTAAEPPPPPPAPTTRRFGLALLAIVGAGALVIGVVAGLGIGSGVTAEPAPTVTVTATTTLVPPYRPSAEPSDEETTEPTGELSAADWTIGIKILSKECFGSAGCVIEFRIVPEYNGVDPLPDGEIEVSYKVTGGEDDIFNTFTVEDGQASFDKEETVDTPRSTSKLKAKATDVELLG